MEKYLTGVKKSPIALEVLLISQVFDHWAI